MVCTLLVKRSNVVVSRVRCGNIEQAKNYVRSVLGASPTLKGDTLTNGTFVVEFQGIKPEDIDPKFQPKIGLLVLSAERKRIRFVGFHDIESARGYAQTMLGFNPIWVQPMEFQTTDEARKGIRIEIVRGMTEEELFPDLYPDEPKRCSMCDGVHGGKFCPLEDTGSEQSFEPWWAQ